MKKLIYFFATLMVLTFGMACQKMTEENQFDSEDILKMEMEDSDIMSEEEQVSLDCSFDYTQLLASCATVTESSSTFPKIITIDYGEGCTDIRGRVKSGRIIVEVSGDMRLEGSVRTITFDQFFVNNTNIQGSRIAENIGANGSGNMVIKVNGDIIATNGSLTRSRTFERYREWISGINTCEFSDDEFLITGSGTATGRRGVEVPHEITEAIHMMPGSCEYPLSGTLDIGGERRGVIIDFGDGECDNIAS
ncbi:MAG: hypothetical protein FJX95_09495, partial [Bacteroidetes bacterium]|nr:hypothetical protein [Bacteroidota bacterium]